MNTLQEKTLHLHSDVQEGFTIIELMIALAIGASVLAGAIYFAMQFLESSKVTTTQTTLQQIKANIENYQLATGEYPNALIDLVKQPQGVKNWRQFFDKELKDAWGNKFIYRRTPDGDHQYELYSYGKYGKKTPKAQRISAW